MARCGCWCIRRITLSFVVSIKTILFTLSPRKIYIFSDNFVQLRFIHWFTSLKMHSFCDSLLNFQIYSNISLCNIWLCLSKSMKSIEKMCASVGWRSLTTKAAETNSLFTSLEWKHTYNHIRIFTESIPSRLHLNLSLHSESMTILLFA